MESLVELDQQWLLAINGAHAPWADTLMWYVSQATTWLPLYALMLVLIWYTMPKVEADGYEKARLYARLAAFVVAILLFAIAVGGSDLICARIIKPLVARPRPTHDPVIGSLVHIVNGYTGGAYGFCSNHAANTMAAALVFCFIYLPNKKGIVRLCTIALLTLWVLLNGYSRMYLGVHYPLDILAGWGVGAAMAFVVWWLVYYLDGRLRRANPAAKG